MPTIFCPYHRQRESFDPPVMQPADNRLVRYPCGYVDGVEQLEPVARPQSTEELEEKVAKLTEMVRQQQYRRAPQHPMAPRVEPPQDKGLIDRYQKEV